MATQNDQLEEQMVSHLSDRCCNLGQHKRLGIDLPSRIQAVALLYVKLLDETMFEKLIDYNRVDKATPICSANSHLPELVVAVACSVGLEVVVC